MATKKSKPQTRSRRNLPSPAAPAPNLEALQGHIERERERLMDAEAVLSCVIYAMEEDVRMDAAGPRYSSVVRIARRLVNATIDQLDSVNIKAAISTLNLSDSVLHKGFPSIAAGTSMAGESTIGKCGGVRDTPPAYVH